MCDLCSDLVEVNMERLQSSSLRRNWLGARTVYMSIGETVERKWWFESGMLKHSHTGS
jgi:hypothetical protein